MLCRAFASRLPTVPMLILAVTESGSANMFFESEQSQNLLTKANEFADSCNASFITTCTNFEQQCMYCVYITRI